MKNTENVTNVILKRNNLKKIKRLFRFVREAMLFVMVKMDGRNVGWEKDGKTVVQHRRYCAAVVVVVCCCYCRCTGCRCYCRCCRLRPLESCWPSSYAVDNLPQRNAAVTAATTLMTPKRHEVGRFPKPIGGVDTFATVAVFFLVRHRHHHCS